MKETYLTIGKTPALLLGEKSDHVYLFVHGQGGNKEEARRFADVACPFGWQVLGIDLPEHGERHGETATFDPWYVVPELQQVMKYMKQNWNCIALRANSVGSWFSLQAFREEELVSCMLVSPLVDMERMITNLMHWSQVTEEQLEKEKEIPTDFGQTLSFPYLTYVREHPVNKWCVPTAILRAEKDEMIDADTVENFSRQFGCDLTVTPGGEHWFHTPEELEILGKWENEFVFNYTDVEDCSTAMLSSQF